MSASDAGMSVDAHEHADSDAQTRGVASPTSIFRRSETLKARREDLAGRLHAARYVYRTRECDYVSRSGA